MEEAQPQPEDNRRQESPELAASEEELVVEGDEEHQQQPEHQSPNKPIEEWEAKARSWLSVLLQECRAVTMSEVEAWVSANKPCLPDHLLSLSQSELLGRFSAIQSALLQEQSNKEVKQSRSPVENPARFQRTDRWLPVYTWLESLDTNELVNSKNIDDWFAANPKIKEELCAKHSRYHLTHYIKKCHIKILRRKKKHKQPLALEASPKVETIEAALPQSNSLSNIPKESELYAAKRNEALRKYEILVELEKQLAAIVPNQ